MIHDVDGHGESGLRSLLRDADFLRAWLIGLVAGVGRWLEMLALGIYAVETTGSPFLVALLVIVRMAPLALFGAIVGTLADRFDRRLFLTLALALMATVSVVMFALLWFRLAGYWHVAVAAFCSGLVWTTEMPLRRRMLGDIAGEERVAKAMGLDSATNNMTRMAGPLLGGVLYQFLGVIGVYGLNIMVFGICTLLASRLVLRGDKERSQVATTTPLKDLIDAVDYARRSSEVLRIFAVTLVFNIWGFPFVAMIPVIGRDDLGLSATWVGMLSGLEGGGAFIGALIIAALARAGQYERIYYFGTMVFLALVFTVGWAPGLVSTALVLITVGLAMACFATMQSTLVYLSAPAEMRGRMFGLLAICIGSGLLGFANVGWMAELFGAANALKIIASEGMVALLLIGPGWRRLGPRR